MNKIEKLLQIGDLRSAGKTEIVIKKVIAEPELFDHVIQTVFSENPAACMRAADVIEKLSRQYPEWLQSYKSLLLNKIAKQEQKEIRWHVAQILPRLTLTKKEREKVYGTMLDYLKDESKIVKTFAMQALTDIATQDTLYVEKVEKIIASCTKSGSPAMQSRGRKLMQTLADLKKSN